MINPISCGIEGLIERIDDKRILDINDNHLILTPEDIRYGQGRPRMPCELSLSKITRKLFVNYADRKFNIHPEITDNERSGLQYFTMLRKEIGSFWLGILIYDILKEYSPQKMQRKPISDFWETTYIPSEDVLLEHIVYDVLRKGSRLFDKRRTITYKGKEYRADDVLMDFIRGHMNQDKELYRRVKNMIRQSKKIPYHMLMHWRKSIPNNRNPVSLVYARIKNSESENIKQAKYWTRDLNDQANLDTFFMFEEFTDNIPTLLQQKFHVQSKYADQKRKEKADHWSFADQTRLDELRAGYYYSVGDSFGITVVFSRNLDTDAISTFIDYIKNHDLFKVVEGTEDDHTTRENTPNEYQFKIRLDRSWLDMALPSTQIYTYCMPDTIEVLLTSLPDIIHKYLTPGIAERDYKARRDDRLGIKNDDSTYIQLLRDLKSISPDQKDKKRYNEHIETIQQNLEYSGPQDIRNLRNQAVLYNLLYAGTNIFH